VDPKNQGALKKNSIIEGMATLDGYRPGQKSKQRHTTIRLIFRSLWWAVFISAIHCPQYGGPR
jgi:hypothetical protein